MTTYTRTFGGQTTYPAQVSYRAVALTANTQLEWPVELATSTDVVTWIMDVIADVGPFSLIMPAADVVAPGNAVLLVNVGSNTFVVEDADGGTILTVASGEGWDLYLTDNSTSAGTWNSIQRGATTSSADAAALAGNGLIAITTKLNVNQPVSELTMDYAPGTTDRAKVYVWTGGAGTITLPVPATVGNGWFISFRNQGSGSVAFTPSSGSINDEASISVSPGDSFDVMTDGTDYFTVGLGQAATFAFDYTSINIAGSGDYTLSGAELNRIAYNFTGLLTGNRDIIVPSTTQQYWITNATTGAFVLGIRTATQPSPGITVDSAAASILYCDGTNVRDADSQGLSTPITILQGGTGATTASGARTNLGATAIGDALFTAASAASGRSTLGLGTMAVQAASAVAITGGTLDAVAITNASAIQATSADAGAAAGPTQDLFRNSASPAASDLIGIITFTGRDSAANVQTYAEIGAQIDDATSTSEDGRLNIATVVAGTKAIRGYVGAGLVMGTPTDLDKGAGTANFTAAYDDGQLLRTLMYNYIGGCTIANNVGDSAHDIDFGPGFCADSTNVYLLAPASTLTKQLDATWAAGTNAGGLFSGSTAVAANVSYHCFFIRKTSDGTIDAGFDSDPACSHIPAGYGTFRRVGSIRQNAANTSIQLFTQYGADFILTDSIIDIDATAPGTSAVTRTLSIPTGVKFRAKITAGMFNGTTTNNNVYISSLDTTDTAITNPTTAGLAGAVNAPVTGSAVWRLFELNVWTNTSAQVRSRCQASGAADHLGIVTYGWMDLRGQ